MKTSHLQVASEPARTDPVIRQTADILRRGGLVAFPTETVYGVGANALNREAVLRIFVAKQRPAWDPVIVHVSSVEMAKSLVKRWPVCVQNLAENFWPGPITLLLPKRDVIPSECTAGRENVGIRIPAHPVARALIEAAGVPVAAPSANRFGSISPTTAQHVLHDLDGRIDAVLDGGPAPVGVESTVIDVTTNPPIIYRPGGLTRERIESVIGPVEVARREVRENVPPTSLESPGLAIRHYAPRATLLLVADQREMGILIEQHLAVGDRVGLMLPDGWLIDGQSRECIVFRWGCISQLEVLASRLYAGLRWLDQQASTVILCPIPPARDIGLAILDRLSKAAR